MKRISGDQCPLLFGKWKPVTLENAYDYDPSRIQHFYDLGFDTVRVYSGVRPVVAPPESFSAERSIHPYSAEELFDPRALQVYRDGKTHVSQKLGKRMDADKVSRFRCVTNLLSRINPGFEFDGLLGRCRCNINTGERAKEVYHETERVLVNEFGLPDMNWDSRFFHREGPTEYDRFLVFPNGVVFYSNVILEGPYDEVPFLSTQNLKMAIISEESGERQEHESVVKKCLDVLREQNEKGLIYGEKEGPPYIGNRSWLIDLSGVEMDSKMKESVFLMK